MKADILKTLRPSDALLLIKTADLRKKYERVLVMRYVHDKSCQDIADELSIEVESARNLVSKARKQFEKYA